jgi:hypothetical protein
MVWHSPCYSPLPPNTLAGTLQVATLDPLASDRKLRLARWSL